MIETGGPRGPDRTVDAGEVAKFAAMAEEWWDPEGKFRPLHRLNPVRLEFLRDRIADRFSRDIRADRPFAGLSVLDVGCGGGLLCEPMARLGAQVTGIDAGGETVAIARAHAEAMGLSIDYRPAAAGDLAAAGETFDVVLNMEVVEHVADRDAFLGDCAKLVRPGGLMVLATLNRTPKAYLLAILGAEYLLRWLPRGTHEWRRFVRPSEMAASLRRGGMTMSGITGVAYDPLQDRWRLAPHDLDVNYMAVAEKPGRD
jgi:2-polyprenyl-6-hydroxyphenyl methylase/3-demethylubiquinone-9 3-methyltransferase